MVYKGTAVHRFNTAILTAVYI